MEIGTSGGVTGPFVTDGGPRATVPRKSRRPALPMMSSRGAAPRPAARSANLPSCRVPNALAIAPDHSSGVLANINTSLNSSRFGSLDATTGWPVARYSCIYRVNELRIPIEYVRHQAHIEMLDVRVEHRSRSGSEHIDVGSLLEREYLIVDIRVTVLRPDEHERPIAVTLHERLQQRPVHLRLQPSGIANARTRDHRHIGRFRCCRSVSGIVHAVRHVSGMRINTAFRFQHRVGMNEYLIGTGQEGQFVRRNFTRCFGK